MIGYLRYDIDKKLDNLYRIYQQKKGRRSINITGDIRAVYEQISKDKVLFVIIASHSKLYD
ncbi:MAG: hypothetical protein V1649_03770 [Patescibacteria group bacterium]